MDQPSTTPMARLSQQLSNKASQIVRMPATIPLPTISKAMTIVQLEALVVIDIRSLVNLLTL